jgi:hypothetical protein
MIENKKQSENSASEKLKFQTVISYIKIIFKDNKTPELEILSSVWLQRKMWNIKTKTIRFIYHPMKSIWNLLQENVKSYITIFNFIWI